MTRLLIATGIFHPESGGPATYLYDILPHLENAGFDVHVLTYGDAPTDGYPYPVTRVPRTRTPLRQWAYARASLPLVRWAQVIYKHTLALPLIGPRRPTVLKIVGDQAWERAVREGWVPPDTDIDTFQIRHYWPAVRLQKRARKREVKRADGVIVPSQYLRKMVIGWQVLPPRVRVIYNALPPAELPAASQVEARAQLGLHPTAPTLLFVGRLVQWKGVDDLIYVLSDLPGVRLVIAGDGTMRDKLEGFAAERGVADRVTFLGRVPHEQVPLYMRAADFTALYSGYEGLSHVLLESLRAGTPVIASHKGGNPEVVQHGINGMLVPYGNPTALRTTIAEVFQRRAEFEPSAGLEKFDHATMVRETIEMLEHIRVRHT